MIKAKQTECGQRKRYGDFFRVWEIETDEPKKAVLEYCFEELCKRKGIPTEDEWRKEIRVDIGSHGHDDGYYFRGCYRLDKTETGFKFTVREPYAD